MSAGVQTMDARAAHGLGSERMVAYAAWTATALAVLIYCLVSLGGLVRGAGAGLSCPDWPLCHGQAVPQQMFNGSAHATGGQIFLEWFHRMIAGTVSMGVVALSFFVYRSAALRKSLGTIMGVAILMLALQVVLGGLTVLGLLSPKWVVSHLLVGLGFFSSMLWMSMSLHRMRKGLSFGTNVSTFAWLAFGAIYAQIFLGGLVSSNYAGLACADFPTCNGEVIPPLVGLVKFQVIHRLGAYTVTAILLGYFFSIRKQISGKSPKIAWTAIPLLIATQICLGAGMIWFQIPLLMSVAHLAVAAALLASTVILLFHFRNSEGQARS